ncbi:protein CHAPERONE-LIKE PROTEIN OF POR1, chloroplastic [Hordeum vulgare subsp. vulgare]|uniref:protein CHAPERONE-LIKE PROTEIN OF POR1, chloroplastic n=1 Tax=Hordeum vulgare subsp. vulgare TaxID=112509 RepID=UPI00162DBC61|nr:protein CHAPERONE-LIKE PROTEIN OF POR1, chloroplastic [Hordeum vulgare subsp. vulgare]
MATALSLSGAAAGAGGSLLRRRPASSTAARCCAVPRGSPPSRRRAPTRRLAASRADDSSPAPFEMTVEGALKLLGVAEGASFDEILRAKKAVVASCKDDPDAVAQVEVAYDMLLMQSLSRRRAGKVVDNSVRYADVKPVKTAGTAPQWMQSAMKNVPLTLEAPASSSLGIQSSIYGALMVFTYASGTSTSLPSAYTSPDVPGFILATGFGASLYFLSKKNMNLGKAALITVGGLAVGATVGSGVESWLQVDIVPFLGIHSPAVVVTEFILFSQLFVSLFVR